VHIAEADKILKSCQHFGFCTSGCPTYVLLHDENDSPRGRIDLIKEMLESAPPKTKTVTHLDRCLSCMSCMTTCAVNVDYMHLIDTARVHIEKTYTRPLPERLLRDLLAFVLPRPRLFAAMMALGRLGRPLTPLLPVALARLVDFIPPPDTGARKPALKVYPAAGARRWRVALLAGCVQPVIAPHINDATIRLLTRFGCEVVVPESAGCCGSLNLHMGKAGAARASARRNVQAWLAEMNGEGLDAIIVNASGCGTTVKDYAHLFLDNDAERADAQKVAALCHDVCEWLAKMALPEPAEARRLRVTYHDACSLRNAQKVTAEPRALLRNAGLHRERRARVAFLLRIGRHLQPAAGRYCPAARRAQGPSHCRHPPADRRGRQHRLPHADRPLQRHGHRAHRRIAGLGTWRRAASGAAAGDAASAGA
jgi:glycolate oxidase iron-sulfur subunit